MSWTAFAYDGRRGAIVNEGGLQEFQIGRGRGRTTPEQFARAIDEIEAEYHVTCMRDFEKLDKDLGNSEFQPKYVSSTWDVMDLFHEAAGYSGVNKYDVARRLGVNTSLFSGSPVAKTALLALECVRSLFEEK